MKTVFYKGVTYVDARTLLESLGLELQDLSSWLALHLSESDKKEGKDFVVLKSKSLIRPVYLLTFPLAKAFIFQSIEASGEILRAKMLEATHEYECHMSRQDACEEELKQEGIL